MPPVSEDIPSIDSEKKIHLGVQNIRSGHELERTAREWTTTSSSKTLVPESRYKLARPPILSH